MSISKWLDLPRRRTSTGASPYLQQSRSGTAQAGGSRPHSRGHHPTGGRGEEDRRWVQRAQVFRDFLPD